jgi:Transposase
LPCLDRDGIYQTPRRALFAPRIYPKQKSFDAVATSGVGVVRDVADDAVVMARARGFCTTWVTWSPDVPATSTWFTRSIVVLGVASRSSRTCRNTPCPNRTTPIASSRSRCGWSLRTACLTNPPVGISGGTIACSFLTPPSRIGSRPGGKKAARQIDAEYLDWALSSFSGYIALDEVYDGPFCILSLVDNRTFKRILYQVLDHDPDHTDIVAFLRRFQAILSRRRLTLKGVTTDASSLYPEPLHLVFPDVPHQICEFHIIKELTKAILRAVAQVRKKLAAQKPVGKRGRPTTITAKRIARRRKRLQQKVADLFEHRYLFVQHTLTPGQRRTLLRITRGLPKLRTLRDIMEEVYRLFDRRCRTDTALAKLAQLRRRVSRFKEVGKILRKLQSPNLDKALTFLDDKLFPSTSNAVERGNRRHRKMQKTVYRVRTQENITNRIALDMFRDSQKPGRTCTIKTLHKARAMKNSQL